MAWVTRQRRRRRAAQSRAKAPSGRRPRRPNLRPRPSPHPRPVPKAPPWTINTSFSSAGSGRALAEWEGGAELRGPVGDPDDVAPLHRGEPGGDLPAAAAEPRGRPRPQQGHRQLRLPSRKGPPLPPPSFPSRSPNLWISLWEARWTWSPSLSSRAPSPSPSWSTSSTTAPRLSRSALQLPPTHPALTPVAARRRCGACSWPW